MSNKPRFEAGDIVKMKCNSVPLIIEQYRGTLSEPKLYYYVCVYFDGRGVIQEKELAETSLREF